jgi:hypothetical protein
MRAAKTFFSFAEITDPTKHRAYNEWHHLDHRPENLMLPGVMWGERWVRTPDCRDASTVNDQRFAGFHYLNLYWFSPPADEHIKEWHELGARSFQWGRRPELRFTGRPFIGFFDPIKGYVNDRVLVSADVLPARPNLGVHLTIAEYKGADPELDDVFHWYDQVHIPDLLECDGAAGMWTFVSDDDNTSHATARDETRVLRFHLVFLDTDPLKFVADMAAREQSWRSAGRLPDHSAVERVLFSGPLRLIRPFEYDWFD